MLGNLLTILLMIALSAFFSASEISYASANELRLRRASETGGQRQKWAFWIYSHYDDAVTALLIGNNLANNAGSALMTVVVISLLGNGYAWVATALMTILLLIFGEILPKLIAKGMPEAFATAVSPVVRGLMWLLRPVIIAVQGFIGLISRLWKGQATDARRVTEDDIEVMLDTAEDEGALDENTTELLYSALEFDDVMAFEILTPRVDMRAIDIDDPMDEIIAEALASPYSRIPVYEEDKDNVIGVLHLNRFMKRLATDGPPDNLRDILLPACFVPKTATLPDVLATMRQRKCHMVVVSDEFGGTLGILTMEDVLEELVGDIWDETDIVDRELSLLPDGQYEASGQMRVHDLLDTLGMDADAFDGESTTLGGWAMEMLGSHPKIGDSFSYEGLQVTVERVRKLRVTKVLVARVPENVALDA